MTVSLRPSALTKANSAPLGSDASAKGWKQIPQINQLRPRGVDKDYVNGAYNCAPAVVAMLARGAGRMGDLTDAQLISQLGKDIVTPEGTDPEGVARMLARVDLPPAGDALGANYKDAELKQHLNQGHMVIAQVRTRDPQANKDSAHYVLIQGMTKNGDYIVSDPLKNKPYAVSPKQLQEAVLHAPPDGGMLIPVSSPTEANKLSGAKASSASAASDGGGSAAPAPTTPRTLSQVGMPVIGPTLAKAPTLTELPAVAPAGPRKPTQTQMPVMGPTLAKAPTLTELPAVMGPVAPRTTTQTQMPVMGPTLAKLPTVTELPAVAPAPTSKPSAFAQVVVAATQAATVAALETPNPTAFTATDEDLGDVDTTFKEPPTAERNAAMEANEQRNHYDLDVRYGDRGGGADEKVSDVTGNEDEDKAAQELRQGKARGDKGAYETLEKLEKSTSDKDRRVLEKVKKADKKDPGIGKKTWGDGF